jgi:hypothetical protein
MDLYYQAIWQWLWLSIFIEWLLDGASIYALFKPFAGILRVLNRFNWAKFLFGVALSYLVKIQGGFEAFDLFLIGSAPVSFLIAFFFAL